MIIVKLMGGLGNQLFQYATGRSLALSRGVALKLDLSFLEEVQEGNTPRHFALHHFGITAQTASAWDVAQMMDGEGRHLEAAVARLIGRLRGCRHYRERWFHFDPEVRALPDNVYLEGYWHSERYFVEHSANIRKELTVTAELMGRNRELADKLSVVNAVSVHVRRGDYVHNPTTNAYHGVCAPEYYHRAAEVIASSVVDPLFVVFSDEPGWAVQHLKFRFPVCHVTDNGETPHEDLRLMSLCKHHIIANSSFSWWGAWLSANPDKIVIAPERWFNNPTINTVDLTPVGWHRI